MAGEERCASLARQAIDAIGLLGGAVMLPQLHVRMRLERNSGAGRAVRRAHRPAAACTP
jgi:hypothetical protein